MATNVPHVLDRLNLDAKGKHTFRGYLSDLRKLCGVVSFQNGEDRLVWPACIVGEGGARQVATLRHSNQVVKQPYGLFGVHPQKQSLSISQGGTEKRTVTRGMRLHFLLRMSDAAG
jgi:hypothetical protein